MYQTVYTELSIQLMPICMFCYMCISYIELIVPVWCSCWLIKFCKKIIIKVGEIYSSNLASISYFTKM